MNDNYGSSGDVETLYWTTFGDPSFVVRSDTPQQLTVLHDNIMIIGSTQFSIQTNSNESVLAISRDGELLAVSTADENGNCTVNLDEPVSIPGTLDIVVTSYNHVPYETEINVIAPDGSYMLLDDFSISNNNDEAVNFSDQVSLSVMIENVGTEASGFITATLINQTDNATVLTPSITFDSVLANQMLEAGPFEFEVSSNVISKLIYDNYKQQPQEFVDGLKQLGLNRKLGLDILGEGAPLIKDASDPTFTGISLPWMLSLIHI